MNLVRSTLVAVVSVWLSAAPLCAQTTGIFADISTSLGTFTVRLDTGRAPRTVANFIGLATGAQPWLDPETGAYRTNRGFYRDTTAHLINYENPTPGTTNVLGFRAGLRAVRDAAGTAAWTGGPGYTIEDEFRSDLKFDGEGILAMANTGMPHTGGSQFFVTLAKTPWLNGKHTIFGKVVKGMDVVRTIGHSEVDFQDRPLETVTMKSVTIKDAE